MFRSYKQLIELHLSGWPRTISWLCRAVIPQRLGLNLMAESRPLCTSHFWNMRTEGFVDITDSCYYRNVFAHLSLPSFCWPEAVHKLTSQFPVLSFWKTHYAMNIRNVFDLLCYQFAYLDIPSPDNQLLGGLRLLSLGACSIGLLSLSPLWEDKSHWPVQSRRKINRLRSNRQVGGGVRRGGKVWLMERFTT